MAGKRDHVLVGFFVLLAAAVLVAMVFSISGVFGRSTKSFHAYFAFAGGLEPGSSVRYAGGPKVGRVDRVKIDPQNPARMDIVFSVQSDVPVKADSHAKIMSMSPLGDNHLEIIPCEQDYDALRNHSCVPAGPLAAAGAQLSSDTYVDFNSLTAQINDLAPQAKQLLATLNDRAGELQETISRVNDLLNKENRANLSATLANARGMLEENRPQIRSAVQNVNAVTQKLQPLLDDLHKTTDQANKTLDHLDGVITDNRQDLRQVVIEARKTLTTLTSITTQLDQTLDVNTENIDEMLDNLRRVSQNLKEFTETIKKRPYTLIRASNPHEHKPGEQQ
jgi:phospholipid/cholesterol/gamma-HCH transport system substrate-binding protein